VTRSIDDAVDASIARASESSPRECTRLESRSSTPTRAPDDEHILRALRLTDTRARSSTRSRLA
jgi:hypothetical protein